MIITIEHKLKCIQRELMMRRRVYTRRVADGMMNQADAEREIQIMLAIEQDYLEHVEKERLL